MAKSNTANNCNIELKNYEKEDLSLQCRAYMKTKLFMAKRIAEQQEEIENLKGHVAYHILKHTEMYDMLTLLNEQLSIKNKFGLNCPQMKEGPLLMIEDDKIDLSGDIVNSLNVSDSKENIEKDILVEENKVHLQILKENLQLRKELETIKNKNDECNLTLSRVTHDKFIIFTELNELVSSLKKIDLNILNKFYQKHVQVEEINNAMGVKFNILSAYSQLLLTAPFNSCKNDKDEKQMFNLETCENLIKHYEEELSKCNNSIGYDNNKIKNMKIRSKIISEDVVVTDYEN